MSWRLALRDQLGPTAAAATATLLTSCALSSTLADGPWFALSVIAVLTVAVLGAVTRSLALPRPAVILIQALGLVLLITVAFAHDDALLGLLPGRATWPVFSGLWTDAMTVITDEVAPVTVTDGIRLLVVGGVGVVALAVDAVAVTYRRAVLAGIPLLMLYLVPAIVLPDGVPAVLFLIAGVGWLILLVSDGQRALRRWGRTVGDDEGRSVSLTGGTGRRVGMAALAVAVVVPMLVPSLDDGRFGGGSGDGDGTGSGSGDGTPGAQTVLTVNPIVDLKRNLSRGEDVPVFAYTTDAEQPDYFRIATLDRFDGLTWVLEEMSAPPEQQASGPLPLPPGLTDPIARTPVSYSVAVGALDTPRLPLPYAVSTVELDGDWRWDADTFDVFTPTEEDSAIGTEYDAEVLAVAPTVEQLRAAPAPDASMNVMLDMPDDVEARLTPLAESVTAGEPTSYDKALALQNWFRSEFQYSLDTVAGNEIEDLELFLRDRSGYCEQFAATMALMARAVGIPSRVQVGFTPGDRAEDGTWIVTLHDAHAWPELWFAGIGWVRFEPTPGGGDGGATPAYAPPPPSPGNDGRLGGRNENAGQGRGPVIRRGGGRLGDLTGREQSLRDLLEANRAQRGFGAVTDGGTGVDEQSSTWPLVGLVALIALIAAAAPRTAAWLRRRARWKRAGTPVAAVEAAWADVLDAAVDVDLEPAATETTRDLAARLPRSGGLRSGSTADLRRLLGWVEQVRYLETVPELPEAHELRALADRVRGDLLESLTPRDRRVIALWPATGRRAIGTVWAEAPEAVAAWWSDQRSAMRRWFRARRRGGAPSALRSGS